MNKYGIRLITAVAASSMIVTPVLAAPSVDDLKKEKAAKQSEVSSLQSQLTSLMGKVNNLELELIQTGENITQAQSDLEVAQEKEKEQYAAMKNCNTNQGNHHANNFTDFQWFFVYSEQSKELYYIRYDQLRDHNQKYRFGRSECLHAFNYRPGNPSPDHSS